MVGKMPDAIVTFQNVRDLRGKEAAKANNTSQYKAPVWSSDVVSLVCLLMVCDGGQNGMLDISIQDA
jgi:hypothetical protein